MSNDSSPRMPTYADSSPSLPTRTPRAARGEGTGNKGDERKQSLYFPGNMLQEMKEEAARLDRSLSWVVQRAWRLAKAEVAHIPSVNDVEDEG
jgi:uncharacterized small protein (TIGR04563 family)